MITKQFSTDSRRGSKKRVGLLRLRLSAFHHDATRGVAEYARTHGNWELLVDTGGEILLDDIASAGLDGIITADGSDVLLVRKLRRVRIPAVDIFPSRIEHGLPQVLPDDREVGRVVARHFLERGHRQFVFFGHPVSWKLPWVEDRFTGFAELLDAAGFEVQRYEKDLESDWTNYGNRRFQKRLRNWLISLRTPVAVFAVNDGRARQIIHSCHQLSIRIPEQISVVGVDNSRPMCEVLEPSLSSVAHDERKTGYEAAAILARLMVGEAVPATPLYISPLPLIARRSSDSLAVLDAEVAEALRFIWDHGSEPLSVQAVADAVAVSRRSLEMRFRTDLQRSISSEIWRVRVENAKQLLRETQLPIPQVAQRSGFQNVPHFCVRFRRDTGLTPSHFRRVNSGH